MSGGLTAAQAAQVAERDLLVRWGLSAASRVRLDRKLLEAPPAVRDRAILSAAIGFLVSAGYTTTPPPSSGPLYIVTPGHLMPDLDAMIEGNRQVREAIFGPHTDPTARGSAD